MYLQILFLNASFMSIYQFLGSNTLPHMVVSIVGGSGESYNILAQFKFNILLDNLTV